MADAEVEATAQVAAPEVVQDAPISAPEPVEETAPEKKVEGKNNSPESKRNGRNGTTSFLSISCMLTRRDRQFRGLQRSYTQEEANDRLCRKCQDQLRKATRDF